MSTARFPRVVHRDKAIAKKAALRLDPTCIHPLLNVMLENHSTVPYTLFSTQDWPLCNDLHEQLTAVHQGLLSSHLHLGDFL